MVRNRVLAVLVVAGLAAAAGLGLLTDAPNRLLSGRPIGLAEIGSAWRWLLVPPAAVLVAGPFLPDRPATHRLVALAGALFAFALVALAGAEARRLAGDAPGPRRISFGAGFWVLGAVAALAGADALGRLKLSPPARILAGLVALSPVLALIAAGGLDRLSILQEYANRRDVFAGALLRHLALVFGALGPALALGLPLGLLAARRPRARAGLFAVLNVIQTVPSIALFAILMAPLGALAEAVPALGRLGLGGIGPAPAIVALTLYSLLPIARNTAAGLDGVPASAIEAGRGMGLTPGQIFRSVELPLALPVFLAGLRITLIQAVGLAAVAALIGAGGLGAIMFEGLGGSALDLVLLGVVPLVALSLAVDLALRLAVSLLPGRPA